MTTFIIMLLLATVAGLAMPIGGLLARIEQIQPRWLENEFRHSVIAFGGGVLLSAVALVLVPHGIEALSVVPVICCFSLGGIAFMGLDLYLSKQANSASNLVAMLADFIPEAIALGAGFASGDSVGYLLALLIGLQNLPEGFNAYREILDQKDAPSPGRVLFLLTVLVPLGPLATLFGYFVLASNPLLIGGIMLFAAGGILYLIFQDIAPAAKLKRAWGPPVGAVFGFLFGVVGEMLI